MKIAILDDHELIRVGVAGTLQSTPHSVTISVSTAAQLFEALEAGTPCDIVLLDILMPDTNGVEVAERLRREYPDIKIIVLSIDNREFTLIQLLKIGMDGFVSKSSPLSEIPLAIDSVANGVPFYGRDISILIRDITDAKLNNKNIAALSKREIEIIKACCDGLMGKEIADKFHISLRAVNSHKTNIFNKLGLSSSVEMVRFAIEHGII
ncbi:MAG: response regulator transcription factor [Paludibacteraceae bacterium]|nr:response regulator transcription factor [Paludibacteraceae bacterium]MBR4704069.1 response regulator transcription factor [Paludibacteraceae bacterium]